eukprot:3474120-Amphidinium_carterae.2
MASFLNAIESLGWWPEDLQNQLYLMLPKEGATRQGERRPIALFPMVYRLWAATQRSWIRDW